MLERRTWHLPKFVRRQSQVDLILGFVLALGVFAFYIQTLVPSVLDGEPGVYQYISSVLGIPDPPGFPLYVLIGYLWSLLPIGVLAYRMNLLSAFFGALTIGLLFVALRQQKLHWLAALGGGLTLALVPPFWQYSILAGKYTLHTFLTVLLFTLLVKWEKTHQTIWLSSAMVAFGFGLANNPSFLLLAPATAIFVIFVDGRPLKNPRALFRNLVLVGVPCALYLYLPLRGHQLLADSFVLPDWHLVIAQGIVSPYFKEDPQGLLQYLTASTFIQTIARSWQWETLIVDGANIIFQTLSIPIVVISLAGLVRLAIERKALALWLSVVLLTFAWIALPYANAVFGTTTDFAPYFLRYFLPGLVGLIICAAWGMDAVLRYIPAFLARFKFQPVISSIIALALVSVLLVASWQDLYMRHSNFWIDSSANIQAKWDTIRKYPPKDGAALVAHWGDLTPFWYLQTSESWRPDLVAIFPPTDERVDQWLGTGKPLYLAGALLDWAPGIVKHYRLTAWGPLVRVSSQEYHPRSPLRNVSNFTFTGNDSGIQLLGYEVSETSLHPNDSLNVALFWKALTDISLDDALVYLSLENSTGQISPTGYPLVVNWFPNKKLTAGEHGLGTYRFLVPKNISSGEYSLRLRIYSINEAQNLRVKINDQLPDFVDLSQIQIQ